MSQDSILKPGYNCWRFAHSRRVAFLVDGEAYFAAFAAAAERARRSILILSWDIDSRIRLRRERADAELPADLGSFLNRLVARRRDLHIHILDWDFALLYALEREPLPALKLGRPAHRRIHFHLDDRHPMGASHHQKIVVIDDAVAFAGGMDLAQARWDTPAHAPADPRRRDNGSCYAPFHDVMMLVDGEAAAALGELARERWRRATGKTLPSAPPGSDPWPAGITPDLRQVKVAISRTEPAFNGHPEVREVEMLYRESIAAARSTIFIENQYLTSAVVGGALAARLLEEKGPEILMVLPREGSGWLEEATMGALRGRLLRQLREADRYGRLFVCYPDAPGLGRQPINIHSKVMIVDDRLVRVGSSNLSNRSLGLDTECDLTIEADREEVRQAIARFRHRLLAEHLGLPETAVARAERAAEGSLLQAVRLLGTTPRALQPLTGREETWLDQVVPERMIVDPEQPMSLEQFIEEVIARNPDRSLHRRLNRRWVILGLIVLAAVGLTALWHWTPLGRALDLSALRSWAVSVRESPWAIFWVVGAFILGGVTMFPVTMLILATAMAFAPMESFVHALTGCMLSAAALYGIGRLIGRETVRRIAGPRLNRLSRQLAKRGLIAVTMVRFVPIAPFSLVNLLAGASHIRFGDFFLGTFFGMAPGILAITIFENRLEQAVRTPEAGNLLILGLVSAAILGCTWLLRRWVARRQGTEKGKQGPGEDHG